MYYAKYLKYKNKYLNLKYQLGGVFTALIRKTEVKKLDSTIPEVSTVLEPDITLRSRLQENLVGINVLKSNSKILAPLVRYNKKFSSNPINFYVYIDKSSASNPEPYILCSLYNYYEILFQLQKKNVKIRRCNVDENGNVTLKLKDVTIPVSSENFIIISDVIKKLMENLVGIKVLQSNSCLLKLLITDKEFKKFAIKNKIHYYTYTDEDGSYILCSLYDYYEFLDILYEHIEIEEVKVDEKGEITPVSGRIYHIIPKPQSVSSKEITLLPMVTTILVKIVEALKLNLFIIIRNNNLAFLTAICMYNLFIGTIHVYAIYQKAIKPNVYLLSLFTQYELEQKCITMPDNIELKEGRLYKQGDRIDIKLNEEFVGMMFNIYNRLRTEGHYANKLKRGDPKIDDQFINQLDKDLLKECKKCVSVKDIAFNTTLLFLPEEIEQGIHLHKDILEIEKDFLKNQFELINSNEKLYLWRYKYENLIQLWEYSLEELKYEVKQFKTELLSLEPCHKELLFLKLKEKGYRGETYDDILKNSALCYFEDDENKDKRLLYENSEQKDKKDDFINDAPYCPEIKKKIKKLDTELESETELFKYKQTVLLSFGDSGKYRDNQSYFFAMSWHMSTDANFDKTFEPLAWTFKLNKLLIQCLVLKDTLIFPFRIINIGLKSPLSVTLNVSDKKKPLQKFCGILHTRFTDDYYGTKNFVEYCRDKLYLIYGYEDKNYKDSSGKTYKPYYYTGNSIKFDVSILPYYRTFVCEINWLYYTFILNFSKIPNFYEYTYLSKKEIVVSRYSLEEIYCKYEENGYDSCELAVLKQVYYNDNYFEENKDMFSELPYYKTQEEIDNFVKKVLYKSKLHSSR